MNITVSVTHVMHICFKLAMFCSSDSSTFKSLKLSSHVEHNQMQEG